MQYENEKKLMWLIHNIITEECWLELQKYKNLSEKYKKDLDIKIKENSEKQNKISGLEFQNEELQEIIRHYESLTDRYFYWDPQEECYDDWYWWGGCCFLWFLVREITRDQKYNIKQNEEV